MDITITIPDDKVTAVVDAFATQYKYQEMIFDDQGVETPNPISKASFARGVIRQFIKDVYIAGVASDIDSTRVDALATAETDIDGVSVS
jgi:hypothetical protein